MLANEGFFLVGFMATKAYLNKEQYSDYVQRIELVLNNEKCEIYFKDNNKLFDNEHDIFGDKEKDRRLFEGTYHQYIGSLWFALLKSKKLMKRYTF